MLKKLIDTFPGKLMLCVALILEVSSQNIFFQKLLMICITDRVTRISKRVGHKKLGGVVDQMINILCGMNVAIF